MGLRSPPTTLAFFRLLLPWFLLLLRPQLSYGFLVAVRPTSVAASTPPSTGLAVTALTVEAEAEPVDGSAADLTEEHPTRSLAPEAVGASSGPGPDFFLSDFQEFVERRRSGAQRVVLDLRPLSEFRREHLEGSTSIPVGELEPRLLELPPPFAEPVSIVGNDENLRAASAFLTNKGWQVDERIGPDLAVIKNGKLWPTEAGSKSLQVWRANEFLQFCVERFLIPSASADITDAVGGAVLDLGCGSGRDTVYMAQRLPPGTRVIGVDNHSYALERGARLAEQWLQHDSPPEGCGGDGDVGGMGSVHSQKRSRVEEASVNDVGEVGAETISLAADRSRTDVRRRACEWFLADLRKEGSLDGLRASVVHGHRFKCEQLLPILRDDVLLPGGYFIWSTFLDTGTENSVPPWRPSRMMRPGELAHIFSGEGFEILIDEQGELPTRGSTVPANFFACRKLKNVM